jgi:hypothetical protein
MAQALETATAESSDIFFELERLEHGDEGRLELVGRWFGVRGRRFVRPTLTLEADGEPRRLLADIEHKPWAPVDGDPWVAAFPWDLDGADVAELELGVAPDIAVELPPPGSEPKRVPARAHRQVVVDEARGGAAEASAAIARHDAAVEKAQELTAERDRAVSERDRAAAELARAVSERDRMVSERDRTVAELARAVSERDRMVSERDRTVAELARLTRARDQAIAACERLIAEKAELQVALDESRALVARAQEERAAALRERELAQVGSVARSTLAAAAPVRRRHMRWQPRAAGQPYGPAGWPVRILALTVLIVAVFAFLLIARIV